MPRMPAALVALSALAACATTGQHAQSDPAHPDSAPQREASRGNDAQGHDNVQRLSPLMDDDSASGDASGRSHGRSAENARPAHPQRVDRQARARVDREDILTQMAFWASEYDSFPNDLEAAQRFSEALRKGGRYDRAVQVADEASRRFPEDRALMLTLGLSALSGGHAQDALRPLAIVAQADEHNWRARSALGAALDQLGRYDEARRAYDEALAISPNQPDVLTNKGVSFLLQREPDQAEPILRQAVALPGAPPQARQNLAIALALQGRFDEAEQLERVDLPPRLVAENMTYLRGLLSDPRRWQDVGRN